MLRLPLLVAVLALCSGILAAPPSREPANLDLHKRELRAYVESGRYTEDIAAVSAEAQAWIERRAPQGGGRLAVVFDLDETLRSNWPHMREMDFAYQPAAWTAWVKDANAPALEPVREVYRAARRLGLEVFFITGRRERDRPGTEKNLRAIGCGDFAALVCLADDSKEPTGKYKTAARARIEDDGRIIIANLGDQQTDLVGGHAERTFKLPNPFYLMP